MDDTDAFKALVAVISGFLVANVPNIVALFELGLSPTKQSALAAIFSGLGGVAVGIYVFIYRRRVIAHKQQLVDTLQANGIPVPPPSKPTP